MRKEFSLSTGKAMINFTAKYCDNSEAVFNSYGFKRVLESYLRTIKRKESNVYKYIENCFGKDDQIVYDEIVNVFKLLIVLKSDEIIKLENKYDRFLEDKDKFILFVEDLYNFWRKLERYTIVQNKKIREGFQNVSFIDANNEFSKLILNTYRKIEENAIGLAPKVYRQLPAGGNAGVILTNSSWDMPEEYKLLKNVPFIESIVLDPPFITYPKKNTRDGMFTECFENPLKKGCSINGDHWFCFPAKVGSLLAYIYFHRDFMAHGVTLCNLFELASEEEYRGKNPDLVYVFGARDDSEEMQTVFYDDKENDIMLGYVNYNEAIDYFGYMKKMTLTLHNLIMIKKGYLPIHGAMVNIITKNGKTANVVIMGDSGAGKSESLEAFRKLADDYISDMTIIFDDMGVVKLDGDNKPKGFGTETGAFVRLDDLDAGYAFKQIDRSIFMNPDKVNARLVIPVASYKEITKGYPIDLFLYANNYEASGEELDFFENKKEAIEVFRSGARMAKGTTTEEGLVKTYFANPFGPMQKREDTDVLLKAYFDKFFESKVKVGQLKTRLGIKGMEKNGPEKAAKMLLEQIRNL
ncbi:phosphoenolpyruvate carboxykinase [Clostridium oceanicum]|uniref:Phosphoenolpyruvate carboxykinase n=1 Tax=Clostridium oceanicum TaxID=1543 RepID=A0ABN1JEV8_9CLOT